MKNIIEIPTSLPYPKLCAFDDIKELNKVYCYVIKKYPLSGIGLTVIRQEGNICIRVSDFAGNLLDVSSQNHIYNSCINEVMIKYTPRIVLTMKLSGIPKAMFYFANIEKPILVDMRLSINKFCGPGFLQDIFGKQGIPIQEQIGSPVVLDEEIIEKLCEGHGDYSHGKFIIKPSAFKSIMRGDQLLPMYGVLENEIKDAT